MSKKQTLLCKDTKNDSQKQQKACVFKYYLQRRHGYQTFFERLNLFFEHINTDIAF